MVNERLVISMQEHTVPRDKWLYNDRGMIKWMGWLLSDHSAYMEQAQHQAQPRPSQPVMALSKINENLQYAWEQSQAVLVQAANLENNQLVAALKGWLVGYDAGQIYLQTETGQVHALVINQLRYVQPLPAEKWWLHGDTP